jgi:hypothetical protein
MDNIQDVSGMPVDDSMMQLEMKRRLARAEALRNQAMPQGQMVGNQFVAPSWTQYLANIVGKIQGGQEERQAIKQYGQFQKDRTAKLSDLLRGQKVEEAIPGTEEMNMPGMVQETYKPYNREEFLSKAAGIMPELGDEMVKAQVGSYFKEDQPVQLGEGGVLVNRKGDVIARNPKAPKLSDKYSNIKVDEQTGKTYGINNESMRVEEIPGSVLSAKQIPPKFQTWAEGNQDITYQINPDGTRTKVAAGPRFKDAGEGGQSKPPAGYQWTPNGTLAAIPGGPGDPNTKPLTQDQSNARLYSTRMVKSDKILSGLEASGKITYNPVAIKAILTGPGVISDATNYYASAETQSAAQAMRDFINATLRRESGATITPPEFDNAMKQYFPQVGDKPEVLAQKRENRATAIAGIAAAGYPGGVAPNAQPSAPAANKQKPIPVPKLKAGGINNKLLINGMTYDVNGRIGTWNAAKQQFDE